jgi:hypothetical protein
VTVFVLLRCDADPAASRSVFATDSSEVFGLDPSDSFATSVSELSFVLSFACVPSVFSSCGPAAGAGGSDADGVDFGVEATTIGDEAGAAAVSAPGAADCIAIGAKVELDTAADGADVAAGAAATVGAEFDCAITVAPGCAVVAADDDGELFAAAGSDCDASLLRTDAGAKRTAAAEAFLLAPFCATGAVAASGTPTGTPIASLSRLRCKIMLTGAGNNSAASAAKPRSKAAKASALRP